jgi:dihydrofolate synthase/folylpolyglutamate synthase
VCAITNIYLEHTAILGATRAAIAAEKAGIVKPGSVVVTGALAPDDEAAALIERTARERGARCVRVEHAGEDSLERRNLRLASTVLEELARELPELARRGVGADALDARARALARLPGRAERRALRGTRVVLDGAHVPESLALVLRDLACDPELAPDPVVVLGMGSEKDARGLLKALQGRADRVLCTSPGDGPYRHPMELRALALELGLAAEVLPDPQAALEQAVRAAGSAGWVLVTGSLHLVGAVRGLTTG